MENKLDLSNIFKIIKKLGYLAFYSNNFLVNKFNYYFLFMTPKYEATTQILINQKEKIKN